MDTPLSTHSTKYSAFALFAFILLCGVLYFLLTHKTSPLETLDSLHQYNQSSEFIVDSQSSEYFMTNPSFPELSEYLGVLADSKGAVYALNTLIYGALPANIDVHLIGHFVAKKLYREFGVDGLVYCTDDLGYACAHAVVIEALFEQGDGVFDEINDICKRVVGDGAYFMCFHGFGHGVLAYANYELPKAIELCEKVGTLPFDYYESSECVGGAIMEMRGGVHDPELWERNGKKYLDEKRPEMMCLSNYMPEKYRYICFMYLTPFIFDSQGAGDIPTYEEYEPAIQYCNILTNVDYREACFGGFAKEFIGFLFGRDIRMIEHMTDTHISQVIAACELAVVEDGIAGCIKHTLIDLLGTGQHGFETAGRVCQLVSDRFTNYCVNELISVVNYSDKFNTEEQKAFCVYIREIFGKDCIVRHEKI